MPPSGHGPEDDDASSWGWKWGAVRDAMVFERNRERLLTHEVVDRIFQGIKAQADVGLAALQFIRIPCQYNATKYLEFFSLAILNQIGLVFLVVRDHQNRPVRSPLQTLDVEFIIKRQYIYGINPNVLYPGVDDQEITIPEGSLH